MRKLLLLILCSSWLLSNSQTWSGLTTLQGVSDTSLNNGVATSVFTKKNALNYGSYKLLTKDRVTALVALDVNNSHYAAKTGNQIVVKQDLTAYPYTIFSCSGAASDTVNYNSSSGSPISTTYFDMGTSNGVGKIKLTKYGGGIYWDVYYGKTLLTSGRSVVSDTITFNYTYNASIGGKVRVLFSIPSHYLYANYQAKPICPSSYTTPITLTFEYAYEGFANGIFKISATDAVAGDLIINTLSATGYTDSGCSNTSGSDYTYVPYTMPKGYSVFYIQGVAPFISGSSTLYYKLANSVVINNVIYYNGGSFNINGQTINVAIVTGCSVIP